MPEEGDLLARIHTGHPPKVPSTLQGDTMSYVPIIVPTPHPPSPQARELADQLSRVIANFEERHPRVSGAEVRQAAQLALQASRGGSAVAPAVAMTMGFLVLLMVGIGVFLVPGSGGLAAVQSPLMGIAIVIALFGVVSVVVRRNL